MSKVNIVCVKVGHKYDHSYVNKLYSMMQRNVTIPHNFVCVTDDNSGLDDAIITIPAVKDDRIKGWWHKISLFKPLGIKGRIIFFDLDTVILSNIDNYIQYDGEFAVLLRFRTKRKFNSAIMSFESGFGREIWDSFQRALDNKEKLTPGDQEWVQKYINDNTKFDMWQKMFPDQIVSYKYHVRDKELGEKVKIVCFHGKPRPHQVKTAWMNKHWR